jgi:thioesterase domain-containing protein
VAFEAALQLLEAGEKVALLALFDTPTPGYPKIARGWKRYARVAVDVWLGVLRGERPISVRDIATHVRELGRIATRRLRARARRAAASANSCGFDSDQ